MRPEQHFWFCTLASVPIRCQGEAGVERHKNSDYARGSCQSLVLDYQGREVEAIHLTEPKMATPMTKPVILQHFIKLTTTGMSTAEEFLLSAARTFQNIQNAASLLQSKHEYNFSHRAVDVFPSQEKTAKLLHATTKHLSQSRVPCIVQLFS